MTLVHFWRFPHLVMENGGGAFLILYLLCLFGVALPVFVAELSFEKIFGPRRDSRFMLRTENFKNHQWVRRLLSWQKGIQVVVWVALFQYFLYIASLAVIHFQSVFSGGSNPVIRLVGTQPSLSFRYLVGLSLLLFVGLAHHKKAYPTVVRVARWVLPLCMLVFVFVLFQILSVGSHIEGVKTMFYPDFLRLRWPSVIEALCHALLSMALGMGWQKLSYIRKMRQDFVSIAINVASLSALVAVFSGLLAIPMVEQMREEAFGANWLFFILPRWLIYGQFGAYYCLLFFLALFLISFFLCTQVLDLFSSFFPHRQRFSSSRWFLALNLFVSVGLIQFFYRENWWALWEQSLILGLDRFFVDFLMPLNGVFSVGILFLFSTRKQRKFVILDQKVLYNAEVFFRYWQVSCGLLFPLLFLVGWFLLVIGL